MNRNIDTDELISLISKEGDFNKEFVDVFIKNLVSLVEDTLISGEDIKIDGIGEFKISQTQNGNNKNIIFISDESLRKEINSPFEHFEPIIINEKDGYEINEDSNYIGDADMNEYEKDNIVSSEITAEIDKKDNQDINPEVEESITTDNEIISTNLDNQTIASPIVDDSITNNINKKLVTDIEPDNNIDMEDDNLKENPSEDQNIKKEENKNESVPPSDKESKDAESNEVCGLGDEETKSECETYVKQTNKSAVMIIIVLIGIAIISFFIYFIIIINKNDRSPNIDKVNEKLDQIIETEKKKDSNSKTDTSTVSSVKKDTKNEEVSKPVKQENLNINETAQNDPALLKIPNSPVKLSPGQRLTLLALRYYGDKTFWVYIYEANKNKYPDPETIPAGAMLRIPPMSEYGINYKDPESVRKAKLAAHRVLKDL